MTSELARILQRNRTNGIYIKIGKDFLCGIGSIMEAEKPHDLLSASGRPRKAGGVVPAQTHRPENQGGGGGVRGVSPGPSLKASVNGREGSQ